jgi:phenylacetate-CoA ligase
MAKIAEKYFLQSPYWFRNLLITAYALREHFNRFGKYYRSDLRNLRSQSLMTAAELDVVQRNELRKLLKYIYRHSRFFRNLMKKQNLSDSDLAAKDPREILSSLPVMTKDDLRCHMGDIASTDTGRKVVATVNTSGTTGTPIDVDFDAQGRQRTFAEWRRFYDLIGLPKHFRSTRFSGRIVVSPSRQRPPFWVQDYLHSRMFMSTYHLTDRNMKYYIEEIEKFRPLLIDGYPSAISTIANFILREGISLSWKPAAIAATAETLLDEDRHHIEKAFGAQVFNQYASSEGAPWIAECKHAKMHVWIDTGVFEFHDIEGSTRDNRRKELVVTSFRNYRVPLIRYKIGDIVEVNGHDAPCPCGLNFPTIERVHGRLDDILYTTSKGYVGRLDPAYKGLTGIVRSKISQISVDRAIVYIVPGDQYGPHIQDALRSNLAERLGDISLEFRIVDEIPLSANGKFKSVERLFNIDTVRESH